MPEGRALRRRSTTEGQSKRRSTKREVEKKVVSQGQRRRKRGPDGIIPVREGVWRVDLEVSRDPGTGLRRRVSRTSQGSREDAAVALARLKVADHEKRLPVGGPRILDRDP